MSDFVITAIVCTRDREGLLAKCLDGLVVQGLSGRFEIIVVDNASSDGTAKLAERYVSQHANVRYVYEPVLGLSRARNRGLLETRTPYVAYIDDDAVARPDWLEQLMWGFEQNEPGPAIVGGEIDAVWEVGPPAWLARQYWHMYSVCLGWSTEPRFLAENEWLCEANLAYDAQALRTAGGFPENLGRKGPVLLSGEGFVNEIILRNGGRAFFNPNARIAHLVLKQRLTTQWLRARHFWGGVTAAIIDLERARLFGCDGKWVDVALPVSTWEWSDIMNVQPDTRLEKSLHYVYSLGYTLGRMGMFPV